MGNHGAWYEETDRSGLIGECAVPLISLLHGLVMGNRIARIVQLGTCSGYSSLLLGFMLRRMNAPRGLFTVDFGPELCALTRRWLERAGLTNFVTVFEGNSLDPATVAAAQRHFGAAPEMILLDSSHEYLATGQELELWYPELQEGGIFLLHDVEYFRGRLRRDRARRRATRFRRMAPKKSRGGSDLSEWRVAHDGFAAAALQGRLWVRDHPQTRHPGTAGGWSGHSTAVDS